MRRGGVTIVSVLLLLAAAPAGAAADGYQWVWSKSWTEAQLRKHFPGATTTCSPVGPPTREAGYNAYAEFACGVAMTNGATYVLVIKPRSKAAWNLLSIEKTTPASTGTAAPGRIGGGGRAYPHAASAHRITFESLDGSLITLEDRSKWLVSPLARYQTVLWHVADGIAVLHGSEKGYPYQLVDTRDGSAASARFLGFEADVSNRARGCSSGCSTT